MAGRDYLESLMEEVKHWLPTETYRRLHARAFPRSGARARWRSPSGPGFFERQVIGQIDKKMFDGVDDGDVKAAWSSLASWHKAAKKKGDDDLVGKVEAGAKIVAGVLRSRDIDVETKSGLLSSIEKAAVSKKWEDEDDWKQVRYRVRNPDLFVEGSLRTTPIGKEKGVGAIMGKLVDGGKWAIQSLRFDKDHGWTLEKAKTWVGDHPDVNKAEDPDRAKLLGGLLGRDEPAVVQAYWDACYRDHPKEPVPYDSVVPIKITGGSDRSLWRINDGWGGRYFLYDDGKAEPVAIKMPDVKAFSFEGPLKRFSGDKALVNALGWSDKAWDRFLVKWFTGDGDDTTKSAWAEQWQELLPESGNGKFTCQARFRDIPEEHVGKSAEELAGADLGFSSDYELLFTGGEAPWGIIGHALNPTVEKLAGCDVEDVYVVVDDGIVVADSKPRAQKTDAGFDVIFPLDSGNYDVGVCTKDAFEIFLDGDHLAGRHRILLSDDGTSWDMERPEDQEPTAKTMTLPDVIDDVKTVGQKHLVWSAPGEKAEVVDVDEDRVRIGRYCEIMKADDEKQIVYGVVMEPDSIDTQGEAARAEEIEKTAHRFMEMYRTVGDQHRTKFKGGVIVESWITPEAMSWNGQQIKKGSWLMGVHIKDAAKWAEVKDGKYTGFSIGGWAARENRG